MYLGTSLGEKDRITKLGKKLKNVTMDILLLSIPSPSFFQAYSIKNTEITYTVLNTPLEIK